jgi:hypothetical protein
LASVIFDAAPALDSINIYFHKESQQYTSVADPGCLSRIPDPDPTFLVIPDPGSYIKKEVKNKFYFFLPDQMISAVNVHTKYYFSSFYIFLK